MLRSLPFLRRPSLHLTVVLLIVFVCAALVGLDVQQRWDDRAERVRQAQVNTANLARSLAEHAQSRLETADSVLIGLRERVLIDGTGPEAISRMEALMRMRIAMQPSLHGLFLLDENGRWLANSVPGTPRDLNYADRSYFRWHRTHASDVLHVSEVLRSKADHTWIIAVTRRLEHLDGSFAGLVMATISADLFQDFYGTFDIGQDGVIVLATSGGEILVRRPFVLENINRSIAANPVFSLVTAGATQNSAEYRAAIDQRLRLGSFHVVPGQDLVIIVSRPKDVVLARWRQETMRHFAILGCVLLCVYVLGSRVARQIRTRVQAEALYRLLADNCSDAIMCTGLDGSRRYVSPSFWTMTGWTERDLVGRSWREIVVPEDRPALEATMAELLAGAPEASVVYRYMRRDGSVLWVESRARLSSPVTGQPPQFIGNIRDISRQRAAEERLAEANAKLAALSLTDPLTGIPNRRCFDEALRSEWARAMRAGTPVAVLMVDADRFKSYNDRYGHVKGDACLQAIARALTDAINRPGDTGARFGGEEFAVILPGLTLDAAAAVAEKIRRAVAGLALPHTGNQGGVVTVSVGVAAAVPGPGSDPAPLLCAADAALYDAKNAGRNRVGITRPSAAELIGVCA